MQANVLACVRDFWLCRLNLSGKVWWSQKSAGVPGSPNNDINPMLGYVTPVISPQLSSATQWFLVGDPREIDTIEIGFVGGQVNPTLFIQDSPLLGLNFSQDSISFKCRHEYGGACVDFRGLYRGV